MPSPKTWPETSLHTKLCLLLCLLSAGGAQCAGIDDSLAALAQGQSEAVQSLALRAGAGESQAQYALGVIMSGSRSDAASQEQAAELLLAAAQAGVIDAADALGNWHFHRGELTQAQQWWSKAASEGHADSQRKWAILTLQDRDSSHHAQALKTLRSVALAGNARAQFALAMYLLEHMPERQQDAERLLQAAAAQGWRPAQQNLGLLLAAEIFPLEDEPKAAPAPRNEPLTAHVPAQVQEPVTAPDAPLEPLVANKIYRSNWILEQNPQHYTIQLATGSNLAALQATLRAESGDNPSAWYELPGPNNTLYSAVVGTFTNYSQASSALAALSDNARSTQPWIRRFSELHRLLR